eukprot:g12483.t1
MLCAGIEKDAQAYWELILPPSELENVCLLTGCQKKAVCNIRQIAKVNHQNALPVLQRPKPSSIVAVVACCEDTHYRSQFETGSSCGLNNREVRDRWERDLFQGAYTGCRDFERPKYGVLNVHNDYRGVVRAKQYGDCYMAERLACLDYYAHVLVEYTDDELRETLKVATTGKLGSSDAILAKGLKYKEAQFHGEVAFARHVERLVLPKVDKYIDREDDIKAVCSKNGWEWCWMEEEKERREKLEAEDKASDDKINAWRAKLKAMAEGPNDDVTVPAGFCKKGCGKPVAPGLTKNGNPYKTCCRGCALGFGHDLRCGLKAGERPPCKMNCGMLAAPGTTSKGRPLDTCCRPSRFLTRQRPQTVYEDLCPSGFYCAEATTFVNRYKFRCPIGFYCPEGTGARKDLKRWLQEGDVFFFKRDFYLSQKVAQFCLRQIMRNRFEFVALEQQRLARAWMPKSTSPISPTIAHNRPHGTTARLRRTVRGLRRTTERPSQDFDLAFCQEDAIVAVWEKFYSEDLKGNDIRAAILALINPVQDFDFLKTQLLQKLLIEPQNYRNKCIDHSLVLGGVEFPVKDCGGDPTCSNRSQLECFCTAPSTAAMLDCFGGDFPDVACLNAPSSEDASCLDPSSDPTNGGAIDDFDLMAGHFLSYVQVSIKQEMQAQKDAGEATMTRCPFGTMTISDGSFYLGNCIKRASPLVRGTAINEKLDMIVQRVNPVDTFLSPKKWVKSTGDRTVNEGEFRPVYFAAAGSVTLITFDAFMLLSSALVEYVEPARANVGTTECFAVKLGKDLKLALPTNMPMQSFDQATNGGAREVITEAFLNWLPVTIPLANYMRPLATAVQGGEMEYVFSDRTLYWGDQEGLFLPYLPYFSNCRGFGRTIPLWSIIEQNQGCKWAPEGGEIGLLSLGSEAKGDSCSLTVVECVLDEVPQVKLQDERWFEAVTGDKLFEPPQLKVYLQEGVPSSGTLPGHVTIAFQYWQRGPGEKMLSVLYYPMTHFEVMVYFAFPMEFYILFYISMGGLSVMAVAVLWGAVLSYHRFMSHLSFPPKLVDFRHWTFFIMPQLRAFIMVAAIAFTPDDCWLGILEWLDSSYGGEDAVSSTNPGERRTGRVGTFMICLAGYTISASLKLLVPKSSSNYYKREEKEQECYYKEAEKGGERPTDTETEVEKELFMEEDPEMPPIFTTHLWKRSALALLVYINAALQIGLLRCAFSQMYRNNIQLFLFTLFMVRITIKIAFTSFMCELMLTVPVAITNQAIGSSFQRPTSAFAQVMYVALIGLQFIERIYIGPNEDVVMGKLAAWKRTMDRYISSLNAAKPKRADDDEDSDGVETTGHNAFFYLIFYLLMYPFQLIADRICVNIAECYHGWKVTDYLEYCAYRFIVRTTDWKGKDNIMDQTLSPHVRSIDQMCFSDQFYFVNLLQTVGVICLIFGMQIIFEARWNVFQDPATPAVLAYAILLCKGTNAMTGVSAGYLKIWVVRYKTWAETGYQQALVKKMQAMSGSTADEKPPPPPAGSAHDGWPEPAHYDKHGLERYRVAFLAENQLWLQVAVSEMMDKKTLEKHRQDLLDGLAPIVNEVAPKDYAPEGTDFSAQEMFTFGGGPKMDLARAASEVQRETYENSALRQLMRMWRERAQFMLFLQQVSAMVKLDNYQRRDACEICGKSKEMSPLVVLPIYTLLHLASLYREQRDMSPLWNTPLWKHFYQTFTPTCTLCEACARYYHKRNTNIPVNEKRYQRLQAKKKSAYERVRSSDYPVITLEPEMKQVLNLWLEWTRCIVREERPQDFLPRFGRTMQEIRKELLEKAGEDDASLPSVSDNDDEAARDDDEIKDPLMIDLEADDIPEKVPLKVPKSLTWSEASIMRSWLHRARDSLQAPQSTHWMYPAETGPSSSSWQEEEARPNEPAKERVRFAKPEDED